MSELPTTWEKCELNDLVEYVTSGSRDWSKFYADSGANFIRTQDINQNELCLDSVAKVQLPEKVEGKRTLVKKDDLLITITGANVGKCAIVNKEVEESYVSQSVALVRLFYSELSPFLHLQLIAARGERTELQKAAYGMGRPVLNLTNIKGLEISLPPLHEQKRIVDKVEELFSELNKGIESLKAAREQLKVYRQALLKHAFEGKLTEQWRKDNADRLETADQLLVRIKQEREARYQRQLEDWKVAIKQWEVDGKERKKPRKPRKLNPIEPISVDALSELTELPETWKWVPWEELLESGDASFKRGPFGSALKKSIFVDKGYKVYEQYCPINDDPYFARYYITPEKFQELQQFAVNAGDFLISCSGVTLGRITQVPDSFEEGIINQALLRVRLNRTAILDQFFIEFFRASYFQGKIFDKAQGAAIPNVKGVKELKAIPLPLISLKEQDEILRLLDQSLSVLDEMEEQVDVSLVKSDALRQSILKKAFSGQLVAQDPNDEPASVLLERIAAEKAEADAKAKKARASKKRRQFKKSSAKVLPFRTKIEGISTTDLHAGILALAYRHYEASDKALQNFGHVKGEKIAHLVEAHLGIDLERKPVKDAAGPNDYPHLMKIESRARKAGFFSVKREGARYVLHKGRQFDALLNKSTGALGDRLGDIEALLELLKPLDTRQAEIVATLYAAWNNLLLDGEHPDDEAIVHEARENWHRDKLGIERDRFFKGLQWMRDKGLVPEGRGEKVVARQRKRK